MATDKPIGLTRVLPNHYNAVMLRPDGFRTPPASSVSGRPIIRRFELIRWKMPDLGGHKVRANPLGHVAQPRVGHKGNPLDVCMVVMNKPEMADHGRPVFHSGLTSQRNQTFAIGVLVQGIGIAPEDREKIWNRLYRAEQSRGTSGSGLGLSMVKAIVEAYGGEVSIESSPEEGSTFSFRIPKHNKAPL